MRMGSRTATFAATAVVCALGFASHATAQNRFDTELSGFNEVHLQTSPSVAMRGAIFTGAKGSFRARLLERRNMIEYELNYDGLEGNVTQAHIHFGQRHTVGGIMVWLCQTATNPAPSDVASVTPQCPQNTQGGAVTGTIGPAQVLSPAGQGIDAGSFADLVRALRSGATYVNVHSSLHGPGEIRGQLDHANHGR